MKNKSSSSTTDCNENENANVNQMTFFWCMRHLILSVIAVVVNKIVIWRQRRRSRRNRLGVSFHLKMAILATTQQFSSEFFCARKTVNSFMKQSKWAMWYIGIGWEFAALHWVLLWCVCVKEILTFIIHLPIYSLSHSVLYSTKRRQWPFSLCVVRTYGPRKNSMMIDTHTFWFVKTVCCICFRR